MYIWEDEVIKTYFKYCGNNLISKRKTTNLSKQLTKICNIACYMKIKTFVEGKMQKRQGENISMWGISQDQLFRNFKC